MCAVCISAIRAICAEYVDRWWGTGTQCTHRAPRGRTTTATQVAGGRTATVGADGGGTMHAGRQRRQNTARNTGPVTEQPVTQPAGRRYTVNELSDVVGVHGRNRTRAL